MNNFLKYATILASAIIILNYAEPLFAISLFRDSDTLNQFQNNLAHKIIFALAHGVALFGIARFFNAIAQKKIVFLLYANIALAVIPKLLDYNSNPSLMPMFAALNTVELALTIAWGIMVLRLDNSINQNIKYVKYFIIATFATLTIGLIATPLVIITQNYEYLIYLQLLSVPFAIAYIILIRMFLKMRENWGIAEIMNK